MNRKVTFLKALGIIAVVNGHLDAGNFVPLAYLYHIPLFFFLSGFLYKEKYTDNPLLMIKQRIKSLYIPYVIYSVLFILSRNMLTSTGIYDGTKSYTASITNFNQYIDYFKAALSFQYGEPLLMAFWFITVLFEVSIIFALIRFVSVKVSPNNPKETTFYIGTIIFLIGFYLTKLNIDLPWQLDKAFIALLFMNLGYIHKDIESKIAYKGKFAFLAMLALLVISKFGKVNMDLRIYTNPPFYILCGLLGIYANFWLATKLLEYRNRFTMFLEWVGENTFAIIALHVLAFKLVTFAIMVVRHLDPATLLIIFPGRIPGKINAFWQLAYTLIGTALPVFLSYSVKELWGSIMKGTNKDLLQKH